MGKSKDHPAIGPLELILANLIGAGCPEYAQWLAKRWGITYIGPIIKHVNEELEPYVDPEVKKVADAWLLADLFEEETEVD